MNRRRGFTLVELLIAIVITGLVMGSVITILFSVFKSYELHQDLSEAKQRGQIALAAIHPFVLNAGLGLPNKEADFQAAFSGLDPVLPAQAARRFKGFVQLASASGDALSSGTAAPALWLVYSEPSGAGVGKEYAVPKNPSPHFPIEVEPFGTLAHASNLSTDASQLKAWISFPSASSPFRISSVDTTAETLSLDSSSDQWIAAFDELHFVRAVKISSAGGVLKIDHLDGTEVRSAADGVAGMWCTFDPEGDRVLTVRVLARSGTKRSDQRQSVIVGWPDDAVPAKSGLDSSYRYAVVSRSWRIRN